MSKIYFDIHIGNPAVYASHLEQHARAVEFVRQHGKQFGLSCTLASLSIEELGLVEVYHKEMGMEGEIRTKPPISLLAGRCIVDLYREKCPKTCTNFESIVLAKHTPKKASAPLAYANTRVFRIIKDYIAQAGDVTRNDGSGGDSIYNGKFNDEKPGLSIPIKPNHIVMANSGKNSNTSQFFFVLPKADPARLAKLVYGKHVVFGEVVSGFDVLEMMSCVGSESGAIAGGEGVQVWIANCGVL